MGLLTPHAFTQLAFTDHLLCQEKSSWKSGSENSWATPEVTVQCTHKHAGPADKEVQEASLRAGEQVLQNGRQSVAAHLG